MTDENDSTPGPDETPGGEGSASDAQGQAEQVDAMLAESATAVRLFDVRRIIGGLFVIYGLVVGIIGLTNGPAEIHKAEGVNINLWTGIGMLVLGLLFLLWLVLSPAKAPDRATIEAENQ
ncbi:MAG TPA: hypothetical protein VGL93_04915 [Streptosporangiaceae bacterium]|jgi:hypothetical protein